MPRKCPRGMKVQTLLFDKKHYKTVPLAMAWVFEHGYKVHKVDMKPNTMRIRQESPSKFTRKSFRTIEFKPGIKAVVGCPKR